MPGVDLMHGRVHIGHRQQLLLQCQIAPLAKPHQPFFGQRLAGVVLDALAFVLHHPADEDALAFLHRQVPAALSQHIAQHAVDDGLGVHQHTVAIEQHRVEPHRWSPST
jgi:hypothetical protein